jgi:hypothetical protein
MEVILSSQTISLTGMLERGLGYYLRSTKTGRFFSQRSKHAVPPDGHWRFIVLCAELTRNKLYITDIRVPRCEVQAALKEAGLPLSGARDVRHELNARDILSLSSSIASECHSDIKKGFGL